MFNKPYHTKKSIGVALGLILATTLSIAAYTSTNLVQDRRISMKEARDWAIKAKVERSELSNRC